MKNKMFAKKIQISISIIVLFFIIGLFYINFSDIKKNKNYSVKFSIELDQKILFHLARFDAILMFGEIKDGREGELRKKIKEFLNSNSVVKNGYADFTRISVTEDFIIVNTNDINNVDIKLKKMIAEINKDINEKITELLRLYISMFEKREEITNQYILGQLEQLKNYKISKDSQEGTNLGELLENANETADVAILKELIEEYLDTSNGLTSTERITSILNKFNTEISYRNIEFLYEKYSQLKNEENINILNLNEAYKNISMIDFIKPGQVNQILDKSPNIYIILLIFILFGVFFSIIYFFGIATQNKKILKSLLRQV